MTDERPSLPELEQTQDFIGRHIGPDETERRQMLRAVGVPSMDTLIQQTVPETVRSRGGLPLASTHTEKDALNYIRHISEENDLKKSLIGMGYHNTVTPAVLRRRVLENPGWYTAYTPYQPEIAQGRLEGLVNFQQMVMDLTGMEMANASMLDEATAAAEAMTLIRRQTKKKKTKRFLVASDVHPQTVAVMRTRAEPLDIEVAVVEPDELAGEDAFGVLIQDPGTFGDIRDHTETVKAVHDNGGLVAVATDLLALTRITPPGEWGADVVVGNSQRFGVPLGFGGPHAAFFATHDKYKRSVPGRIIGVSTDVNGTPAMRMALQTREQHIRREKATSNICTAQTLLANMAAFYACWHGPKGLTTIATRIHRLTGILARGLERQGYTIVNDTFFDTLTVDAGGEAEAILYRARDRGFNLRLINDSQVGIALDETVERHEIEELWRAFAGQNEIGMRARELDDEPVEGIPEAFQRRSGFLQHPVFNSYHTETEMLRYLHRLARRDIALDRSMIPLGSCTMKLNAASEMEPISWPRFANIHPFAPKEQARGYMRLIREVETMLARLTGFQTVTVQPNSGAQGEYTGLLVIRAYHRSRGEGHRNVVLIPTSAHGTNPASAKMAGCDVQLIECADNGDVDMDDLRAKAEKHSDRLAGLMITYPSTHGVFEEQISEICELIHAHGGQVYMDGANLNALLGVAYPAEFGADVCHFNLHKTFCIPHGGGGPGVGPIGMAAHLAPFKPGHPLEPSVGGNQAIGPVAATPWGSAGILPIPWMYITLMGAEGLQQATETAILNANYLAQRLSEGYPILFTGKNGFVAHECIVDTRVLDEEAGIGADDVAKRLIDYGFHAPTMSWPVPGTFMVEPTESECKEEIDRFCHAMLQIREEARKVARGDWPADDNPLVNAPHTEAGVMSDEWPHPYGRRTAAYPDPWLKADNYWPPVARVDNAKGDRHLVCSCPPVEAYRDAAE